MPFISEKDQQTLKDRFRRELKNEVTIRLFTQRTLRLTIPGRECPYCDDTQRLLEELTSLSRKLHLDIKDFYPSIRYQRIYDFFIDQQCSPDVARILTKLTTRKHVLPLGTSTSPFLADQIVCPIDRRIGGLAKARGLTYTRYIDDVTLSGRFDLERLADRIAKIISQAGFTIKRSKMEFYRPGDGKERIITGVRVQDGNVRAPSTYVDVLRGELTLAREESMHEHVHGYFETRQQYRGKIGYVMWLDASEGAKLLETVRNLSRQPQLTRDVIDARIKKEKEQAVKDKLAGLRRRVLQLGLIDILNKRTESQLTFSGQWADLAQYDPRIGELLFGLVEEELVPAYIREAAMNAIADLKRTELVPRLRGMADDLLNPDWLIEAAGLALSELGDRSWVDRRLATLKKELDANVGDVPRRYAAYKQLARYHYRVGEYRQAIADYEGSTSILEGRLKTIDEENADFLRRTLWLTYYNTACSAAKAGLIDDAFAYIERALTTRADAQSAREMERNVQEDGDLRPLRADKRYGKLREKLRALSRKKTIES